MFSCDHLRHPFQNDPGTSQEERAPANLLGDTTPIDDRSIADLLNYFTALSGQINFYNPDLSVGSWKPFFNGSLPFLLSSISSYSGDAVQERMDEVTALFQRHPTPEGLQLLFYQSYYTAIYPLQQWSAGLAGSGLDLEMKIRKLISDRLVASIAAYIRHANTAVHCFRISMPVFTELQGNPSWGLGVAALGVYDEGFPCGVPSQRSQLLALQAELSSLVTDFVEVLKLVTPQAAGPVNKSLYALLTGNGQANTPPHLALLFSFLNQFLQVQADLNTLPKKHLDFFYQQVMRLAPGASVPDNAYIIFSLPKQKPSYVLAAGTRLKAGKDGNGADVSFTVAQDSFLTQSQVTSLRTVFVNQQQWGAQTYTEGVYMAPDATTADGISKPFRDPANAAWATLGAKQSFYTPPGAATATNYPMARLGFILASRVLLMKEGKRTVRIQLSCQWRGICDDGIDFTALFAKAQEAVGSSYVVITDDVLEKALIMGVRPPTIGKLRLFYLTDACKKSPCDAQKVYSRGQALVQIPADKAAQVAFWNKEMAAVGGVAPYETQILLDILTPQSLFMVSFSGEKAWLTADTISMKLTPVGAASTFLWEIEAEIEPGRPAVSFYDASKLGEDFNTKDPLVKIQLNDMIKWELADVPASAVSCLNQKGDGCGQGMSAYEFFRNIVLVAGVNAGPNSSVQTTMTVTVCGVTGLVLQNDDNVLDGNKNFAPFGTKPAVVDFDVYPLEQPDGNNEAPNYGKLNLVGPSFLIGSQEIFLKKWTQLYLNVNWVGKPTDLNDYYKAYIQFPKNNNVNLCSPGHQVNLALLHDGVWYKEGVSSKTLSNEFQPSIKDNNRKLFPNTGCTSGAVIEIAKSKQAAPAPRDAMSIGFPTCAAKDTINTDTFSIQPGDFSGLPALDFDPAFASFTQYSTTLRNGFLRLTLEYQDFLHKVYPWVLTRHVLDQAHKLRDDEEHSAPNEPWTPLIQKGMSIDYSATATLEDIQLIQLYPFDGTYNTVDIAGEPPLFATFCNEGNLFIGLSGVVPGESLSILFQLAEATGDTEDKGGVFSWSFLTNNGWQPLRPGFEILGDETNGLTTTGVVKFVFPDSISNDNTVLPAGQYWISASMSANTGASSQALAVVTQAVLATYMPSSVNDPLRASTPIAAGTISKLVLPDAAISKVNQPFDSFGGSAPEAAGSSYYLRVSERIRHKGRAIQKWDYERIVLQQFPKLLRAKCINHTQALDNHIYRMDFPVSPGDVIVAVLPDINQLAVADNLQPTVPVSMLLAIEKFLSDKISPWARLVVRNPRYEPVNICVTVVLAEDADPNVAEDQLAADLQNFLAPWLSGDAEAFQFGQRLYLSGIIGVVESRDYVAALVGLMIGRQGETIGSPAFIDPLTPRSILVAGTIEVTIAPAASTNELFWKKRLKR
jgi:hypothetical protein